MPVRSRLEPDRDLVSQELRSSDEISQLVLDVENFRDAVMILGRQRPYRQVDALWPSAQGGVAVGGVLRFVFRFGGLQRAEAFSFEAMKLSKGFRWSCQGSSMECW